MKQKKEQKDRKKIEKSAKGWVLSGGNLVLEIDRMTGCLSFLKISGENNFVWTVHSGDVTVRDDLIRKTFDLRDIRRVQVTAVSEDSLTLKKYFAGAPWYLEERYRVEDQVIGWEAKVMLDKGDFRSCAVSYHIPWPQPLYFMAFWAAKENMPSAPDRFAGIALEYGEVSSGILMPALCSYLEKEQAGLLLVMPFEFKTPRFRFISSYRDPDLQAQFDWMALSTHQPASTSLLFRGTGGAWRPELGWLYERYREYFEPRSTLIHKLWGGHVSGKCNVSLKQAKAMADLGLAWHEIHEHFPAYGNYHPEKMVNWRSGHARKDTTLITVDMIRQTIKNLHVVNSAAMPYIQVSGDGDAKLLDSQFINSRVKDRYKNYIYTGYTEGINFCNVYQMNSDPNLPFGKDITRQINGMVSRYPDMDGVFLDQACYNWLDTAHDDGITAVNNRPAYMTGFNYFPHLEHLSSLLHPHKAIIGNGPFGIGIMKYIDGFMSESSGWLCNHFQYYGLAKPMFFLMYQPHDRDVELMFQRCLIYAAGYTSYAEAAPSKDLYRKYVPLLERLFRRRWVFDPKPMETPAGFNGGVFRNPSGNLLVSIVSEEARLSGRALRDNTVCVRTFDIEQVIKVTLQQPGTKISTIPFKKENGAVLFDVPGDVVAAVVELHFAK